MGNGYFRTSQASTSSSRQQGDKRDKTTYSYQHNYVDRVRVEDTHHHHNPHCHQKQLRVATAGWRHSKLVNHLDLATSCPAAAGIGLDHHHHQRLHHHQSHHQHHQHHHFHAHAQPHWTQCHVGKGQLRNARSLDCTQLEGQHEEENSALDIAEFYWRFDAEAGLLDQVTAVNNNFDPETPAATASTNEAGGETTVQTTATTSSTAASTTTATLLDILGSGESCSLRRSRSLAVIREETFSDLQIGLANSNSNNNNNSSRRRRSQLIPRARLVNRGFFRESPRFNNKIQKTTTSTTEQQPVEQGILTAVPATSTAAAADATQRQQQQQQQPQPRDFDIYYDNLKRLDALALGLGLSEQQLQLHHQQHQHPWHNDKSDLESLNSDYFKNSLHQNQHQHLGEQQPSSLEEVSTILKEVRPRLYQSRRQQQQRSYNHPHCIRHIDLGLESCPEHSQSQSSLFPETTTTSNSADDQTDDSPSLSEQEYDLTHIEEIFKQEGNERQEDVDTEESYELISLTTTTTTTTRTRFDTSEEEQQNQQLQQDNENGDSIAIQTEKANRKIQARLPASDNESQLDKLIAYDSVYLSSEDSSECTLIGESCCESFTSCLESTGELESRSLLHISIEDSVYEPTKAKQYKKESEEEAQQHSLLTTTTTKTTVEASQIFSQISKIETNLGVTSSVASKPNILSVVEKRKFKPSNNLQELEIKRQTSDLHVVTNTKSNLQENQYHSLPDVNIGVSLNVCENIDKELRSSYNQQKLQQRRHQESKQNQNHQHHHHHQMVTRAETFDSIRRFGRAHQKARQKEREREREKESNKETERETTHTEEEIENPQIYNHQQEKFIDIEIEDETLVPPPPPPLKKEETGEGEKGEQKKEELKLETKQSSIEQLQLPEETPVTEVANFSKLIERRAQELRGARKENNHHQTLPKTQSFQIIITDAQNNIIQTEAINEKPQTKQISPKSGQRSLRRSVSSHSGSSPSGKQQKPAERRILYTGRAAIYKARPVKLVDSFRIMSRPQILHVVDSRGGEGEGGAATLRRRSMASNVSSANGEKVSEYLQKVDAVRCYWNKLAGNTERQNDECGEKLKDNNENENENENEKGKQSSTTSVNFQLGGETTTQSSPSSTNHTKVSTNSTDYCSTLMPPSIEIVELGVGSQKATIVSAAQDKYDDNDEEQFDHIRYKVLKSQQLIRSNILNSRNKKEAQFDGLIQYLEDYSFQELLSNNNVVIVEPVRTKIERPLALGSCLAATSATASSNCESSKQPRIIHASSAKPIRSSRPGGSGGPVAKRHFFYQPVRVNRELYEDELPDPDTVRNVRRFFEQNILPTPGRGLLVQSQQKFGGSACQLNPRETRQVENRNYRYLTVDTSYGGGVEQPKGMDLLLEEERDQRKGITKHWDNVSLSSGISSGDLSSPCGEYLHHQHQHQQQKQEDTPDQACKDVHVQDVVRRHNSNAANAKAKVRRSWCFGGAGGTGDSLYRQIYENNLSQGQRTLADDNENDDGNNIEDNLEEPEEEDMCENYYVSNDVLAKIRECGSTVTYYGGRVLEKTIQKQPSLQKSSYSSQKQYKTCSRIRQIETCNVCLPNERCQHQLQTKHGGFDDDSYQGIKFKLVKSNSCSSRLELAGAYNNYDDDDPGHLETEVVRKMVHHFEGANQPSMTNDLTINSQSTTATSTETILPKPVAANRRQVTVNNHINVLREKPAETEIRADVYGKAMQLPDALNVTLNSQHDKENRLTAEEILISTVTYQNQQQPLTNAKVCRNKNVDLAYTLVKPQHPSSTKTAVEAIRGNNFIEIPNSNRHYDKQDNQKFGNQYSSSSNDSKERKDDTTTIGGPQIIVPVEIHQQVMPTPGPERRLSNASSSAPSNSTASIVDKTVVVRYYVANDKSIYERRKYDDIEFEEFEVYNPNKDQHEQQPEDQKQVKPSQDSEPYDSLDDRM